MSNSSTNVGLVSLSNQTMSSVNKLRITVLVEDSATVNKPDLVAKHGLSLLVETSFAGTDTTILFDAGPPPDIASQNADTMCIDLHRVDAVFISHGHYDHGGGLLEILKRINRSIPMLAHPRIFSPKFSHKPCLRHIGLGFDPSVVTNARGTLILARNPVKIVDGVTTSGEVTRETLFEKSKRLWTIENENFVEDVVIDDQALVINVSGKGLVVVTGCAHSGVINTLKHAQKITGIGNIHAIIGGLHLADADEDRLQPSIDELVKMKVGFVYPCHCTGSKAVHRIQETLGKRCKSIHTGDVIEI